MYIHKLDDIVNEYNNTYIEQLKSSLLMLKTMHILILVKKLMIKILNLKLVIMLGYQNTKTLLLKAILQIGLKVFAIKEIKNTVPGASVIDDVNGEEIIGTFHEKELQKTNQEEFRIEKAICQMERI